MINSQVSMAVLDGRLCSMSLSSCFSLGFSVLVCHTNTCVCVCVCVSVWVWVCRCVGGGGGGGEEGKCVNILRECE